MTFIIKQPIFDFGLRRLCPEVHGLHFVSTMLMCFALTQEFFTSKSTYLLFGFLHRHFNLSVSNKQQQTNNNNKNTSHTSLESLFWLMSSTLCNHPISKIEGHLRYLISQIYLSSWSPSHLPPLHFYCSFLDACSLVSTSPPFSSQPNKPMFLKLVVLKV